MEKVGGYWRELPTFSPSGILWGGLALQNGPVRPVQTGGAVIWEGCKRRYHRHRWPRPGWALGKL